MRFLVLIALIGVFGCAGRFEETRGSIRVGVPELSARCVSLDGQHRAWGGVAKGSGVVAGGLGAVAAIPGESTEARVGVGAGALVLGGLAATAVFVSEDAAASYVKDGCGK